MDRISELPDELLVKILSYVPTKVAVSTSILSKRWEYLWMWLPKLELAYFNDETLQRLLSNCPILEDLVVDLRDYDDETAGKLTVSVPSLQSLSLYIPYNSVIDGHVIKTPSLKYFKLLDDSRYHHHYLIEKMPCLIEAYLDVSLTDLNGIFGSITSVKRLAICSEAIMLVEGFVFNQLEHLEVCMCTLFSSADQLIELLKASSKLKRLDISFMDHHTPSGMVYWNQPTTVPECLLSSLQSFNWSKYTGEPEERDVVVYVLKHARHLRTATIKSSESSGVPKSEMLKELELSPRASSSCQLIFE